MADTRIDERGAERCTRIKMGAVENVKGDPSKGFHQAQVYCNKPMLMSVAEKRKICPDCEKPPVEGKPTPRVTNASGVALTVKEMEECGLKPDGTRIDGKEIKTVAVVAAPQAVEAQVEVKKDPNTVTIDVTLDEIQSAEDIAAMLIQRVSASMDKLPVTNFGESKRLIRLQEKLEGLLKG